MRRAAVILLVLAVGAAAALAIGAGNGGSNNEYTVELDNAFGLIEGGDLKIAGVRAGKVKSLDLDQKTKRALVGIEITQTGFGSLRSDVTCSSRPQSLIGEYFLDCEPGHSPKLLPKGATIPVSHTSSTVAPDLVNDILRRPFRERLSIIIGELGAGVAGNGDNLNAAVRRASPALRETDKVLKTLAAQSRIINNLNHDADGVIGDLNANRKDVGRFVVSAGNAATASAERRAQLAEGFRRLPAFLEELRPTMAALGRVATAQTPTLRNLNASAGQLETLFKRLGPFADASRPAFRGLGSASKTGDAAVKSAKDTVGLLSQFAGGAPELANNLAIILKHIDDRDHAVEADPRSPGGKGYTGLEALLQYIYDQVLSINTFDSEKHMLKITPILGRCADYTDLERLKSTPGLEEECAGRLGPSAPGINRPDPTATNPPAARTHTDKRAASKPVLPRILQPLLPPSLQPQAPAPPAPTGPLGLPIPKIQLPKIDLPKIGHDLLGGGGSPDDQRSQRGLLDFLLRP
jgi:virulence factor Mce-like protein